MTKLNGCLAITILACVVQFSSIASATEPNLVSVHKIWDKAPHNGFTDLIRFNDRWYCTFREGQGHVSHDGILKVIASDDGNQWESVATFKSLRGFDMREAKFSITPGGRLMLIGAEANRKTDPTEHQSLVWFTSDGKSWTETRRVADPDLNYTALQWLDPEKGTLTEFLKLPSGGDTSYAGLVWHDGLLWISYYASHEGKTSIYLAKVRFEK